MNGVTKRHAQPNDEEESGDDMDITNDSNSANEIKKESTGSANVVSTTRLKFNAPKQAKSKFEDFSRGQVRRVYFIHIFF
jgi:hypothetical protein